MSAVGRLQKTSVLVVGDRWTSAGRSLELAGGQSAVGTVLTMTLFFQKWQCVEDASGKLKLHKCKGMANLAAAGNSKGTSNILPKYYNRNSEDCNCEENEYKLSHAGRRKKLFSKKSK